MGGVAILISVIKIRNLCDQVLHLRASLLESRFGFGDFYPGSNMIKVLTMRVSRHLKFHVVVLPGLGLSLIHI